MIFGFDCTFLTLYACVLIVLIIELLAHISIKLVDFHTINVNRDL